MSTLELTVQSWRGRLVLIAMSTTCLVTLVGATIFTFTVNLGLGIYPVDGDSIGIPIGLAFMFALVALIWVSVAICLPKSRKAWCGLSALMLALLTSTLVNDALAFADGVHWPIALVNWVAVGCHAYIAKVCWSATRHLPSRVSKHL